MSGVSEFGICDICKKEANLQRTYYRYSFKCDCHSPQHFELVCHCKDCIPTPPKSTVVHVAPLPASPQEAPKEQGEWQTESPFCPYCGKHKNLPIGIITELCMCGQSQQGQEAIDDDGIWKLDEDETQLITEWRWAKKCIENARFSSAAMGIDVCKQILDKTL